MIPLSNIDLITLRIAVSHASLYQGSDKVASKFTLVVGAFASIAYQHGLNLPTNPAGSQTARRIEDMFINKISPLIDQLCSNPFDSSKSIIHIYANMQKLSNAIIDLIKYTGNKGFIVPAGAEDWIGDLLQMLEMFGILVEIDMADNRV